MGDACEVQEMLINLVDNACNAMPQGGKLSLATRETDSGILHPCSRIQAQASQLRIWPECSARSSPPARGSGGVGLGLYVSKHIAEKYGGSIAVNSQVGAGTVFTIFASQRDAKGGQGRTPARVSLV